MVYNHLKLEISLCFVDDNASFSVSKCSVFAIDCYTNMAAISGVPIQGTIKNGVFNTSSTEKGKSK